MSGITWHEWAQQIWPGLTDDEAGVLLWNCTCFPLGPNELVEEQLREALKSSGGNVQLALDQCADALDAAMTKFHEANP